ncbi:hypothetical protein BDZ45DRAFT_749580 [Acephala macrosclerotiorum]|nr:hypothetical protein BDZ45DRAFT_749580 [Acephala macrosclerotiorum]
MDGKGNDGVSSHGEATNFCRLLVSIRTEFHSPGARATLKATQRFGLMLANEGKLEESEALLKTAMDGLTKLLGPVHAGAWRTKDTLSLTARRLWHWGICEAIAREQIEFDEFLRAKGGCVIMTEAHENLAQLYGEEHSMTIVAARNLAMCHLAVGNTQICRKGSDNEKIQGNVGYDPSRQRNPRCDPYPEHRLVISPLCSN